MTTVLTPLHVPLTVSSGYSVKEESTFEIRCHDRFFRDAAVYNGDGDKAFALEAKGLFQSWSIRRSLRDAQGHLVWVLQHYSSKFKQWIVKDPDGKQLCMIKDGLTPQKSTAAQALVSTDTGDLTISIRSFDHAGTRTVFDIEGAAIAEMLLIENNDVSFLHKRDLNRSLWRLQVAGGVDISLILALAFCRAEILHYFRR